MASALTTAQPHSHRGKRFIFNVFWNWLGVAASVVSGLLISPYMIRKLGPEGYGIYALSFALVEYYWLLDLGFRSATVKYVAHYWATRESGKLSEVVNTGVTYAGIIAALVFTATMLGARYLDRFFQISPVYRESFVTLVILISLSWCVGAVFSLYGACLEALQRFDLYNRVLVSVTVTRALGLVVLLYKGYGLIAIGAMTVASQVCGYVLYFYFFKRLFPDYRLSFTQTRLATLREMAKYGIHNFLGTIAMQLLNQGPPILIGHYKPAAFVGIYQIPQRLVQYAGEVVGRVGAITNSNAAELIAKGERRPLAQLAVFANRYCLTLFMPVSIVLFTHGTPFLLLWVPKVANACAPLMKVILAAYVIGFIGQFSSSMLLVGLAKHQRYARGLLVEAALSIGALIFVIPRYGVLGAAWVTAICMVLNRGLFVPWLVSRALDLRYVWYMNSIYTRPLVTGLPVLALAWWLRSTVLPGRNWFELGAISVIVGSLYYALAFFICLPFDHKSMLTKWLKRKLAPAVQPA